MRLFPFNANIVSLCAACSGRSMVYSSRKRPRKIQGLLVNLVVAVFAFYAGLTLGTATATNHHHAMAMATSLAAALVGAFTGATGTINELGSNTISNNFNGGSLIGTSGFPIDNTNAPAAFLNVMFLPEEESIDLVKDITFAYVTMK